LSLGNNYSGIDVNSNIVINFNKSLYCYLCIVGKCSYGKWPKLDTNANKTYLTLAAYIKDENGDWLEISDADYKYTFDYGNTAWGGYKENGNSWGSDYGTHWRYRPYKFTPYDIYITGNKSDFVTYGNQTYTNLTYINTLLQKNKTLDIYIAIKNARMEAYGEKGKNVVQGVVMYTPMAYGNITMQNSVINNQSSPGIHAPENSSDYKNAASLIMAYNKKSENTNESLTILTKNGISICSNKTLFGFGYGTDEWDGNRQKPFIYFYDHDVWKNSNSQVDRFLFPLANLYKLNNLLSASSAYMEYGI
jgi:hypothetical protein